MDAVLIYTDTNQINDEIAVLNKVVTLYQSVYTAIKAAGVTPTIADIDGLAQQFQKQYNVNDQIKNYIMGKLLDAAAPYTFNGVTFTREAVSTMLAVPDLSAIISYLNGVRTTFSSRTRGARLNLLTLASNTISKVSDANAQITALYTYYTKSDASAQLATDLLTVCAALNTFDTSYHGYFAKEIPKPLENHLTRYPKNTTMPGLKLLNDGTFAVDIEFIRKFESTGSLFAK